MIAKMKEWLKAWLEILNPWKNSRFTSKSKIMDQMLEPRPLPMGMKEFEEWSDRIISGALIPCEDKDSLKAALASMLMALGPQEDHKPDAYFIHSLRKAATNEIAHGAFQEIKRKKEAEIAAEEEKKSKEKTKKELKKVSASGG